MLKYLIIQLDDNAVSFCHYQRYHTQRNLIPLEILKEGIKWSMKENLTIQFIYPNYEIPEDYKMEISKTFHADIVPGGCKDFQLVENADVVVFDGIKEVNNFSFRKDQTYAVRISFHSFLDNQKWLYSILPKVERVNIVLTDIISISKEEELSYAEALEILSKKVTEEFRQGHGVQINLLTDRILLDDMNNCKAGEETIALCPDGNFYICPAFYEEKEISFSIGDPYKGLNIKNPQLYKISHAPICRICDAYQCRRCIWLNKKSTLEVNTPGREQCVVAHIERNASRNLLAMLRELGTFLPGKEIPDLSYLDPFEKLQELG